MSVLLLSHSACLQHDPGPYHPECPDRLRAVTRALETEEFSDLIRDEAPQATMEQLTRVHPARYVEAILGIRPEAGEQVALADVGRQLEGLGAGAEEERGSEDPAGHHGVGSDSLVRQRPARQANPLPQSPSITHSATPLPRPAPTA